MGIPKRRRYTWIIDPKCLICDIQTDPTIIHYDKEFIVRGWKCPRCGLTLINPNDIPKALELVRETAKV